MNKMHLSKTVFLSVSHAKWAEDTRPSVRLVGMHLTESGFLENTLVQSIPVQNGLTLTVCDTYTGSYAGLCNHTKEQGGKLLTVSLASIKGAVHPRIQTTGQYISKGGLAAGDPLIARYDAGVIQMRKYSLPALGFFDTVHSRMQTVISFKNRNGHGRTPKIRLNDVWLHEAGFERNVLVSLRSEPGIITLALQSGEQKYSELVRYARLHKLRLIQVSWEKSRPCIGISGNALLQAGFDIDDIFVVTWKYGEITCRKIPFEQLGF